jgi:hypothetical protein
MLKMKAESYSQQCRIFHLLQNVRQSVDRVICPTISFSASIWTVSYLSLSSGRDGTVRTENLSLVSHVHDMPECLGTAGTKGSFLQDKIKSRLNSGIACCHMVNTLSYCILFKHLNLVICCFIWARSLMCRIAPPHLPILTA